MELRLEIHTVHLGTVLAPLESSFFAHVMKMDHSTQANILTRHPSLQCSKIR